MAKPGTFEYLFADFVEAFGGIVLPEASTGRTADYHFLRYNVIAELKTLMVDSTQDMSRKVGEMLREWDGDLATLPFEDGPRGHQLAISGAPKEVADKWAAKLLNQVDRIVGEANGQIRDTKIREGRKNARGVLLIANPSNTYHSDPESYKHLLVAILRKKNGEGMLKYPHINACVYFAAGELVTPRGYFWENIIIEQWIGENVSDIRKFQDDLKLGLISYVKNTMKLIAERDSGCKEPSVAK